MLHELRCSATISLPLKFPFLVDGATNENERRITVSVSRVAFIVRSAFFEWERFPQSQEVIFSRSGY
jgi:hypothetical protein